MNDMYPLNVLLQPNNPTLLFLCFIPKWFTPEKTRHKCHGDSWVSHTKVL